MKRNERRGKEGKEKKKVMFGLWSTKNSFAEWSEVIDHVWRTGSDSPLFKWANNNHFRTHLEGIIIHNFSGSDSSGSSNCRSSSTYQRSQWMIRNRWRRWCPHAEFNSPLHLYSYWSLHTANSRQCPNKSWYSRICPWSHLQFHPLHLDNSHNLRNSPLHV